MATAAPTDANGMYRVGGMDAGDMNARVLVDVPYVVELALDWLQREESSRPAYVAQALTRLNGSHHPTVHWPPAKEQPWGEPPDTLRALLI